MFDSSGVPLIHIYITLWYYALRCRRCRRCRLSMKKEKTLQRIIHAFAATHNIFLIRLILSYFFHIHITDVFFLCLVCVYVCIYFMLYRLCSRWFYFSLKFYEIMEFEFLIFVFVCDIWSKCPRSDVVQCLQCNLYIKVFYKKSLKENIKEQPSKSTKTKK